MVVNRIQQANKQQTTRTKHVELLMNTQRMRVHVTFGIVDGFETERTLQLGVNRHDLKRQAISDEDYKPTA